MMTPFLTIAITTYNRHDLLREALLCILAQDFDDYQVIVGNDYQAEVLTCEMLGISDRRVRIINHPVNLREVGNMNALLAAAQGRYFTWLFDDDFYEPGFFRAVHTALQEHNFPPALFPSYRVVRGTEYNPTEQLRCQQSLEFCGRDFLRAYFSGTARLISTCGLFDTVKLRQLTGGMTPLANSTIGLYSEFYFLIQCALFDRIVFMNAPYVVFRAHQGSWGETNTDLHTYYAAGEQLVRRSAQILHDEKLYRDLQRNLVAVCKIHLSTFCFAAVRYVHAEKRRGPSAVIRALTLLLPEISRQYGLVANAAVATGGLLLNLRFAGLWLKCIYLILFSFAYHWWKKWRSVAGG